MICRNNKEKLDRSTALRWVFPVDLFVFEQSRRLSYFWTGEVFDRQNQLWAAAACAMLTKPEQQHHSWRRQRWACASGSSVLWCCANRRLLADPGENTHKLGRADTYFHATIDCNSFSTRRKTVNRVFVWSFLWSIFKFSEMVFIFTTLFLRFPIKTVSRRACDLFCFFTKAMQTVTLISGRKALKSQKKRFFNINKSLK